MNNRGCYNNLLKMKARFRLLGLSVFTSGIVNLAAMCDVACKFIANIVTLCTALKKQYTMMYRFE